MTARLSARDPARMTSEPVRNPLADRLITPENSAVALIDYLPEIVEIVLTDRLLQA
jgi:hypothetical protein